MMSIQALNGISTNLVSEKDEYIKLTGNESFTYALEAAKNLLETNKAAEEEVANKTIEYMTGASDNVVDLMVAQEKSSILLQYTLQVRNGLLSAYKEIISLQI